MLGKLYNHFHANDLLQMLKDAKDKKLPVYAAEGPCGGCDLVIPKKSDPLNIEDIEKKLDEAATENLAVYPAKGSCGACDVCFV